MPVCSDMLCWCRSSAVASFSHACTFECAIWYILYNIAWHTCTCPCRTWHAKALWEDDSDNSNENLPLMFHSISFRARLFLAITLVLLLFVCQSDGPHLGIAITDALCCCCIAPFLYAICFYFFTFCASWSPKKKPNFLHNFFKLILARLLLLLIYCKCSWIFCPTKVFFSHKMKYRYVGWC